MGKCVREKEEVCLRLNAKLESWSCSCEDSGVLGFFFFFIFILGLVSFSLVTARKPRGICVERERESTAAAKCRALQKERKGRAEVQGKQWEEEENKGLRNEKLIVSFRVTASRPKGEKW